MTFEDAIREYSTLDEESALDVAGEVREMFLKGYSYDDLEETLLAWGVDLDALEFLIL